MSQSQLISLVVDIRSMEVMVPLQMISNIPEWLRFVQLGDQRPKLVPLLINWLVRLRSDCCHLHMVEF